jgi:hypothetical protein
MEQASIYQCYEKGVLLSEKLKVVMIIWALSVKFVKKRFNVKKVFLI